MPKLRYVLGGIWENISRRRRLQLGLLMLVTLASGIAEVFTLAAVVPFLSVITDPEQLWQVPGLQSSVTIIGINQAEDLLLPTTVLFGLAAIISATVRLVNLWLNARLAALIGADISCDAFRRTLYQPYSVHVKRNSSEVITAATTQTNETVNLINNVLQLITSSFVIAALVVALILVDWQVTCTGAAVLGSTYIFLVFTNKQKLMSNSVLIAHNMRKQHKILQEGLGAIRDVLLNRSQKIYISIYSNTIIPMRLRQADNSYLASFPRYGIEAIGLILMAGMALVLKGQESDSTKLIPILGAFAIGAQRLLPAIQQVYSRWASIRSSSASVSAVLELLNQPLPIIKESLKSKMPTLNNKIVIENLSYRYSFDNPIILQKISFQIERGESIGIIGSTGSGKSTLINLIMGLLIPTSGKVTVDGIDINDSFNTDYLINWQSSIAHVPQSIFLTDNTIFENIAFGVPKEMINFQRVREVAWQAQIGDFIERSSDGYQTIVGERGIRLSGGQRQRLGIARALYKEARILILDEATSSVDVDTEAALMREINDSLADLTIIMIAHRLSTIESCDRVITLKRGKIKKIT